MFQNDDDFTLRCGAVTIMLMADVIVRKIIIIIIIDPINVCDRIDVINYVMHCENAVELR